MRQKEQKCSEQSICFLPDSDTVPPSSVTLKSLFSLPFYFQASFRHCLFLFSLSTADLHLLPNNFERLSFSPLPIPT